MKGFLAAAAAFAVLVFAAGSSAVTPGRALIQATSRVSSQHSSGAGTVTVYDLYNRPRFGRIGSAIRVCTPAGSVSACQEYLRFSRGLVAAAGLIGPSGFYQLAVTGGTGYYENTGGTMDVTPLGGGAQQIVVRLRAF